MLIRKGTEHLPAKPEEITNLQAQVKTVAQVPILVGDHRLSVEIVTPKNDFTLSSDKYATIDQRIGSRLYQMFMVHGGSGSPRSDDSVKLAKVIARGMESRRFMMKRALERYIIRPTILVNEQLTEDAKLRFHPTRIELDFDAATGPGFRSFNEHDSESLVSLRPGRTYTRRAGGCPRDPKWSPPVVLN